MTQAVHIFLKDTRQQRYGIAVVLAWMVVLLVAGSVQQLPFQTPRSFVQVLGWAFADIAKWVLPVSWWFLVSRVFHAEAIPGDRQFWLTRPYGRGSLFGAKGLFVLAYITVPLGVAQITAVLFQGFPLGSSLPGLLWAQVLVLALIVLPAAVLASLTSKLTQFLLVALAVPLLVESQGALPAWGALEWIRASLAMGVGIAIAGIVLFVQFTRRRTTLSRVVAVAGVLAVVAALALMPWRTAFALQAHVAGESQSSLTATLVKLEPRHGGIGRPLWLQLAGLPGDTPIACDGSEATVESQAGTWTTSLRINSARTMKSTISEGCALDLGRIARLAGDYPVNLHAILYVTVFGPARTTTVPINDSPTIIPETGMCVGLTRTDYIRTSGETIDNTRTLVGCQSAFRDPRQVILFLSPEGELSPGRVSYSPFAADLRLLPVDDVAFSNSPPAQAVNVVTREPIAHVKIPVDVQGIKLDDFLK